MIRILLISLITVYLAGCVSTTEVVDGLCYNEKEGTFICDKPENRRRDIQEEKEEIEECDDEDKTFHGHCVNPLEYLEVKSKFHNIA
tara:strand:+ start:1101 stop:1361 length:261 start_codon:yes stop_codon:yes gene_type:complete